MITTAFSSNRAKTHIAPKLNFMRSF